MIEDKFRGKTIALDEMYELVQPGIYALINYEDSKVDVRHTGNILNAVTRHITKLKHGVHPSKLLTRDKEKISIVILETIEDFQTRLLSHTDWCNRLKERGFKFYRLRPALTYKVKLVIENYEARVKLVNQNHDALVVGCFASISEAEDFVAHYYASKCFMPVYACNELTKRYHSKKKA